MYQVIRVIDRSSSISRAGAVAVCPVVNHASATSLLRHQQQRAFVGNTRSSMALGSLQPVLCGLLLSAQRGGVWAAPASHQIETLPGWKGPLPSKVCLYVSRGSTASLYHCASAPHTRSLAVCRPTRGTSTPGLTRRATLPTVCTSTTCS